MLSRIYGTAFPKKSELDAYLARLEEAKKRDHRRLGKELGLFTMLDEGPGFPFFLPKGMILKNELINYWREVHTRARLSGNLHPHHAQPRPVGAFGTLGSL